MEQSLADDLRQHRPAAIDRLLVEHGIDIQAVAQVILRDRDEAADVLANTVVAAWERARHLREASDIRTWLFGIAVDEALRRHRVPGLLAAPDELLGSAESPFLAAPETQRIILEGLVLLEPRERAMIALHCLEDLSIDDVASVLRISPSSVRARMADALATLQFSLIDEAAPAGTHVEAVRVSRRG